jgi:capsular polysaccharide transport system permease protein
MTTTFKQSLKIQIRVIGALLLREIITRYGRHNIGFLWLFLEPMLFTLGVAALWTALKLNHGSDIPIVAFAITGYSSILLWRNAASRCSGAIEPNLSLMYHRNVKVIDIFLSRIILEVLGASFSIIVLTLLFSSIGWMEVPKNITIVLEGWILLAWFATALSLIVGALSERSETLERMWHILTYLLFPLSGAMFMVHWLPKSFQNIITWFPMVHGTEMIRHGYFGSMIPTYENPFYFTVVNLILTFIGLLLVRYTERHVELE